MNFFIKNVYFCVFMMIVNDNTKYGVCLDLHICCIQCIYTYMHVQYVVSCILISDLCKI